MHEFSIIENLFKIIKKTAQDNNLASISSVSLKIGQLRQIVPDFLEEAFHIVAEDTIAKDAKLKLEILPIVIQCNQCKKEAPLKSRTYECPTCQSTDLVFISGKELYVDSIEGEQNNAH